MRKIYFARKNKPGEKAVRLITSERRSLYEEWKNWQANPEWEFPKLSPNWDEVNLSFDEQEQLHPIGFSLRYKEISKKRLKKTPPNKACT